MKEAIILAGGFGTRLQGVIKDIPKPMAPVHNKPFLCYLLDYLNEYNYSHVVFSTGYLHEKIEDYFGEQYKSIKISYAQELSPLGTGGAIQFAMSKCFTDNVLVMNGDTMFKVDLNRFEDFYKEKNCLLAVALREVPDVSRYGSVYVGDDHQIILFSEKGASEGQGLINGGTYLINRNIFNKYPQAEKFSFEKDLMEKYFTKELFFAMESAGYFIDIGIPKDYERAQFEL
ncbi:MAG: nucleotidyltransferase family protein [Bacteroidales bacterium]|nr:nucleotidyltransferase family protein [Bacteroidales bacterium]